MRIRYIRILFIWLGVGVMLTSFLYIYEKGKNRGIKYVGSTHTKGKNSTYYPNRTYYEYPGVITLGGALIILGLAFKEEN